jgi:hypothetical protein
MEVGPPGVPLYEATIVWLPPVSVAMPKVAWPLASRGSAGLMGVLPSRKVTVPSVTGVAPLVTATV